MEHRGREAGRVKPGSTHGVPQGGRPAWGGTGVGRWRSAGLVEGGREEGVNFFLPASGVRRGRREHRGLRGWQVSEKVF